MERHSQRVNEGVKFVGDVTGERFVREARGTKTYGDITSNLRNSIGYISTGNDEESKAFGGGKGGQAG